MTALRGAVWLFREVNLPSLWSHRLRAVLTLVGVVIGVQVVVAIAVLNRSILSSFQHTVETISGGADLQVSNGTGGVPEELVEELLLVEGVRSAAPLVQGRVAAVWGDVSVFGVDLLGDQESRAAHVRREDVRIPDPHAFVTAPAAVAVSTTLAERVGLTLGQTIEVVGPRGVSRLTVGGFVEPVWAASLFGGAVGLMDLQPAQQMLGRLDLVDQIDIVIHARADLAEVQRRIQATLQGRGVVEPPRARAARLGGMLAGVQTLLTILSLIATVVGAFIVYHSMATTIAQRRRELALVRAIGFRKGAVIIATLLEALAFGLVGSLLGILLGTIAAQAALGTVAGGVDAIWARVDPAGLVLTRTDVLVAIGVGLMTSLVAAIVPARSAARATVIEELRDDPTGSEPSMGTFGWAGALMVGGYVLLSLPIRADGFALRVGVIMGGVVLVALAFAAIAPFVAQALLVLPARVSARRANLPLAMATENVSRDAVKARGALAALMVAFAMVLIVNAFVRSLRGSLLTWVDQTLACDLYVSPSHQLPLPSGPTMAASLADRIRRVPGVLDVSAGRMLTVQVGGAPTVLRTDSPSGLERQRYPIIEGGGAEFLADFAKGTAVMISDNLAYRQQLRVGDVLPFDTPSGRQTFRVGAVAIDYTLDIGAVVVEEATFRRLWKDDLTNIIGVWVRPDADRTVVREAVAAALPADVPALVMTGGAFKATIAGVLDQALMATHAVQLIAIAIALLGVTNFFLAAMIDRRREIGLLRSVALTGAQIQRLLAWEALLLGLVGGCLAIAYAWPLSYLLVTQSTRLVSGWQLTFSFSQALALVVVLAAAITAVAGAYLPARHAVKTRVVDLVSYQ